MSETRIRPSQVTVVVILIWIAFALTVVGAIATTDKFSSAQLLFLGGPGQIVVLSAAAFVCHCICIHNA